MTLREKYTKTIKTELGTKLGITNPMAIPHVVKVVVNSGLGEATKNKDVITKFATDLEIIAGQKPSVRKAHLSISGFGLRAGMPIGLKVTLRGERAYNFLDKLFNITLPRLRDFRGIPNKGFDGRGSYTLGLTEHTVFPDIDISKIDRPRGLQVTVVTSARDDAQAKQLLADLGAPFSKE